MGSEAYRGTSSQRGIVGLSVFCALLGPVTAHAEPGSQELGWHESYEIQQEDSGLKLITTDGEVVQSLEILGTSAGMDDRSQVLEPDEAWRKSFQVNAKSGDGNLFNTEFRSNFTEVWQDSEATPGTLQVLGETGTGSKALTGLRFSAGFLNDRISISTEREASTWVPVDDYRGTSRGVSQQTTANAVLFQSASAKLSVDGVSSRVDPNYWDLTNAPVTDPLLVRNRSTAQLRSTATMDRFTLNLFQRESEALTASHPGDILPQQNETGAVASVSLSDLHRDGRGYGGTMFALIPDSIWVSGSQGVVTARQNSSASFGPVSIDSIGANRSWSTGNAYVSYWNTVQAVPQTGSPDIWSGHGTDLGANLDFGQWYIYGGLSMYSAGNVGWLNHSAENSVSGTLLVSWKPNVGPAITAGVVSYTYGYSMFDFGGFNGSDLRRYEVALDFSHPISTQLGRDISVKLLASYCDTGTQWRWEDAGFDQEIGGVYAGVRLGFPFRP